jgi:hypothetical protein
MSWQFITQASLLKLESFNRQLMAEHQALKKEMEAFKPSSVLAAGKSSH